MSINTADTCIFLPLILPKRDLRWISSILPNGRVLPWKVVGRFVDETLCGDVKLYLRLWWQVNRQACTVYRQ